MTNWSRLIESDLGRTAKTAYDANPARSYHNWDHVLRLYWHATHTFALPYDADLDKAILAHDVVYDAGPDKEIRSADWLEAHSDAAEAAARAHILKTIEHRPSGDNRMVLLDLADFLHPELAVPNLDKIMAESLALYGVTELQFLSANLTVVGGLHQRISEGLDEDLPADDVRWFRKILTGIENSITLATARLQAAEG